MERSEVVRLSQNSITGRKSNSTVSGGSCTSRSAGMNPSSRPKTTSTSGSASRTRGASSVPTRIVSPSRTVISRPSMRITPLPSRACAQRAQSTAPVRETVFPTGRRRKGLVPGSAARAVVRQLLERPRVAVGVVEGHETPPRLLVDPDCFDAHRTQLRQRTVRVGHDDLDRVLLPRLELEAEAGAEGDG